MTLQETKKNTGWMLPSFFAVMILCLFVHVFHPYLWGPDEPREAEVARELLRSGDYATLTFDSVPYVEKPPLYYNLLAFSFRLSGGLYPGAARSVSALLATLMLGSIFFLAKKRDGFSLAAVSVLLCMSMPQFYRAGHFILLDIGVGAFLTAALAIYGYLVLTPEKRKSSFWFSCFYLCVAAAFLTKGTITLVYMGAVLIPFFFLQRKNFFFRLNWTLLFFLIPVGLWLFFFWQKGGVYYLHEHFINNIFGRLLHKSLHLEGAPLMISDVGNSAPVSFYLERYPSMFAGAGLIVVAALISYLRSAHVNLQNCLKWKPVQNKLLQKISAAWEGITAPRPLTEDDRMFLQYLLCWSFCPIILLSLPAAKEVTYILPSYAGLALFAGEYLLKHVPGDDFSGSQLIRFLLLPLAAFALVTQLTSDHSLLLCMILCGILFVLLVVEGGGSIRRKQWRSLILILLAGSIGSVMIGNIPALMRKTRMNRKCYNEFAIDVWKQVGTRSLFIYGGDESMRGAVPFFGDRNIILLMRNQKKHFPEIFAKPEGKAILMPESTYNRLMKEIPELQELVKKYQVVQPDFSHLADTFLLLIGEEQ